LAHGNFFLGFIAELNDGSIIIIEHKVKLITNSDSAWKTLGRWFMGKVFISKYWMQSVSCYETCAQRHCYSPGT